MAKKTPNYTITKRKDAVDIRLSNDAYKHLFHELKLILETFCKADATLDDIGYHFPIAMILMASHEVLKDLSVGDRMIDKQE